MDKIDNVLIIMIVLLLSTLYALYKMYQTQVDSKTFITCIYLYLLLSLTLISILSKYTATLSITDSENVGKMVILYFIIACSGLLFIFNSSPLMNHIGLLLLCISMSLVIGVTYRNSKNISDALIATSFIVLALTLFVFSSNETTLTSFTSWLPSLTSILCLLIIVELSYGLLYGPNEQFYKMASIFTVILFVWFILADTSKLLIESKQLNCQTHSCINYPQKTVGLLLDYINLFTSLNNS